MSMHSGATSLAIAEAILSIDVFLQRLTKRVVTARRALALPASSSVPWPNAAAAHALAKGGGTGELF
jgi:hypothetical protein